MHTPPRHAKAASGLPAIVGTQVAVNVDCCQYDGVDECLGWSAHACSVGLCPLVLVCGMRSNNQTLQNGVAGTLGDRGGRDRGSWANATPRFAVSSAHT